MKLFLPVVLCALSVASLASANARVCSLNQTTSVREATTGKAVGQVKANTPVVVSSYDVDDKGKMLAFITWQGQPLTAARHPSLQHQGWVNREVVNCKD